MKIFIHGVADTAAVWNKVRANLQDFETDALSLPGFGVPLSEGFNASKEAYVTWLIRTLESFHEPVDLVGHDWGAMLAIRIASLRPDLVRTVAVGNGPVSEDYEWHSLAKVWQQKGEGERFMETLTPDSFSAILVHLGLDKNDAGSAAKHLDVRMKNAILRLYRSALEVGKEWAPQLSSIACPTLIYWGRLDQECQVSSAYKMASHIPLSRVIEFDCGHWVQLESPSELASALRNFWDEQAMRSDRAR